ncbi:uncharacterized protein LOC121978294 [Zingiber officinale]|uniref:uncharacterized protein LOC121978294 n=1 Tax=Zingiber officinale TaxID=94328 RepID=UPI001C4D9C40|nr:uncharacterized protein LOC121978294 [Zingiber officinale]
MVKLLLYDLELTGSNIRNNLLQSKARLHTIDHFSGLRVVLKTHVAPLSGRICLSNCNLGKNCLFEFEDSLGNENFTGFGFIVKLHTVIPVTVCLFELVFLLVNWMTSFQDLLQKQNGERALWEYPFAVAGVNITFMLIQMLDLQLAKPRSFIAAVFLKLLSENDQAFDIMYCITFKLMDHQWLTMHASYMDFNIVMKSTRRRLEQELLLKSVSRIEDLPSYRLLAC